MKPGPKILDPKKRFMELIEKTDYCWLWKGSTANNGYGAFRGKNRIRTTAHRYAYEFFKGPVPKSKIVCHKCDNRKCVNPDHLWIGTHFQNTHDAINKGRVSFNKDGGFKKFCCKCKCCPH